MRYIVVLFWSLILGQIVAYLGAALTQGMYNFPQAVAGSIFLALMVCLVSELSQPKEKKQV